MAFIQRDRRGLMPLCGAIGALALSAGALLPASAIAQRADTEERVIDTANATRLPVVIVAVEGRVRIRDRATASWRMARPGMILREGAEAFTGPKSALRIKVGSGQVLTLDRIGKMKLEQAINDGVAERTRIDLEFGRMGFDVDSKRFKNDVKIRTPDATLSVVGTQGAVEFDTSYGTRAFGTEENRGTFLLTYANGVTATVTRNHATDAAAPAPAQRAKRDRAVDPGAPRSRETGETKLIARTTGESDIIIETGVSANTSTFAMLPDARPDGPAGGSGGGNNGGGNNGGGNNGGGTEPIDPTRSFIAIDDDGLRIVRIGLDGAVEQLQKIEADQSTMDGLALRIDPDTNTPQLVQLQVTSENGDTVNTILASPSGNVSGTLQPVGTVTGTTLKGLGALGTEVYAIGDLGLATDRLYQLKLSSVVAPEIVMDTGMRLSALAGGTSSVTGAGYLDGSNGPVLTLLEMDPRINAITNAWSDLNGDFISGAGLGLDQATEVTGLASVDGTIILSTTIPGQQSTVYFSYDPNADSDKRVQRLDEAGAIRSMALAGGVTTESGPSIELSPGSGAIDASIGSQFAQMGFTQAAFDSGVVTRLTEDAVVRTASDGSGCRSSGSLSTLPGFLMNRVNERAGIGRAVSDFRASLTPDHPCRPPAGG